jgi:hypothetical protein
MSRTRLGVRRSGETAPDQEGGYSAAQRAECRCSEIFYRWVSSGREMLKVLKYRGIYPEITDDPNAGWAGAIAADRNRR